MKPAEVGTPTAPAPGRWPQARRVLRYAVRLALVGLLALACWEAAVGWFALLGDGTGSRKTVTDEGPPDLPPVDLLAALPGGHWHFPGLPWGVNARRMSSRAVDAVLEDAPSAPAQAPSGEGERAWLALVESALPVLRQDNGTAVRGLDRADLKARVFATRRDGRDRLLLGRVALRRPDGDWDLIEVRAGTGSAAVPDPQAGLLPLPPGSHRLCTRTDSKGATVCEAVTAVGSIGAIVEAWRRHGWNVRPLPRTDGGPAGWVCWREGECVHVLAGPSAEAGPATLLLLRAG
jgi:hypothetical protein